MKLKLEQKDNITILVVTESVAAAQIAVLKAGLKKLFQAGKTLVIMDLLAIPHASLQDQATLAELATLPTWCREQGAQIAVVSTAPGVGTASSRDEGISALKSPLAGLQAMESKLLAQLTLLESQKKDLSQKLAAVGAADGRALRRENTELKKTITAIEEMIRRYLKGRSEPYQSPALKAKEQAVLSILTNVLVQEGAIPPRVQK